MYMDMYVKEIKSFHVFVYNKRKFNAGTIVYREPCSSLAVQMYFSINYCIRYIPDVFQITVRKDNRR